MELLFLVSNFYNSKNTIVHPATNLLFFFLYIYSPSPALKRLFVPLSTQGNSSSKFSTKRLFAWYLTHRRAANHGWTKVGMCPGTSVLFSSFFSQKAWRWIMKTLRPESGNLRCWQKRLNASTHAAPILTTTLQVQRVQGFPGFECKESRPHESRAQS